MTGCSGTSLYTVSHREFCIDFIVGNVPPLVWGRNNEAAQWTRAHIHWWGKKSCSMWPRYVKQKV
jgi:hypothetical protein